MANLGDYTNGYTCVGRGLFVLWSTFHQCPHPQPYQSVTDFRPVDVQRLDEIVRRLDEMERKLDHALGIDSAMAHFGLDG